MNRVPFAYRFCMDVGKNFWGSLYAMLGAIIGAGLASGSEAAVYFAPFGKWAALALLCCAFFFGLLYYCFAAYMQQHHISTLRALCLHTLGYAGKWLYYAISACSIIIAAAMLSAVRLGGDQLGAPGVLLAALCVCGGGLAAFRSERIGMVCSVAVPLLLFSTLVLFFTLPKQEQPGNYTLRLWVNPPVYALYNTSLSLGLLASISSRLSRRGHKALAVVLGSLLFMLLGVILSMVGNSHAELPLLWASRGGARIICALALFLAVFTTYLSALYNVKETFHSPLAVWGGSMIAYAASFFPLSAFVRYAYPAMGMAGVILLCAMLYKKITNK